MPFLTKDMIVSADDCKRELVSIPEWGGDAYIKTLTGTERDRFEADIVSSNKKGNRSFNMENLRARLVALTLVDENNRRIFDNPKELGMKSALVLSRLFTTAQKLNGMTNDDVEELAGNSEDALSVDFTSG